MLNIKQKSTIHDQQLANNLSLDAIDSMVTDYNARRIIDEKWRLEKMIQIEEDALRIDVQIRKISEEIVQNAQFLVPTP